MALSHPLSSATFTHCYTSFAGSWNTSTTMVKGYVLDIVAGEELPAFEFEGKTWLSANQSRGKIVVDSVVYNCESVFNHSRDMHSCHLEVREFLSMIQRHGTHLEKYQTFVDIYTAVYPNFSGRVLVALGQFGQSYSWGEKYLMEPEEGNIETTLATHAEKFTRL